MGGDLRRGEKERDERGGEGGYNYGRRLPEQEGDREREAEGGKERRERVQPTPVKPFNW